MKTTLGTTVFALVSVLFMGCDFINPAEPLPAYLVIPEFEFYTTESGQGSATENITEIWVFADDQVIGAFQPPCEVPILAEGATSIELFAGIKNNGVASDRYRYPFYTAHEEIVELRPLQKDTIRPSFTYRETANITIADDFENSSVFTLDVGSQGSFTRITTPEFVLTGDGVGYGHIPSEESLLKIITNEQSYVLPGNKISYLEFDYKTNNSMAVGLVAVSPAGDNREYLVIINPTTDENGVEQWNKMYVELSATVATYASFSDFEIFFESLEDTNGKVVDFYLDNIKLVHF